MNRNVASSRIYLSLSLSLKGLVTCRLSLARCGHCTLHAPSALARSLTPILYTATPEPPTLIPQPQTLNPNP